MSDPETRPSLLLRIRDPDDREAWNEFAIMYRPVIVQMARRRGMQPADADDLAQHVLWTISQAIDRFEHDDGRAKFRTWLKTIARRAIINALTRGVSDKGTGGSAAMTLLQELPMPSEEVETLQMEYRRETFQVAAAQIRDEFQTETWQAFWRTVVLDHSVDDVAAAMSRSRGSVYTARSRVMSRLKEKVHELDGGDK